MWNFTDLGDSMYEEDWGLLEMGLSTICCIGIMMMKHRQKLDVPLFSDGYRKCMLVDPLSEYIGPFSLCSLLSAE